MESSDEVTRKRWRTADRPVIVSAAMFRRDVKSQGLAWLIRTVGRLQDPPAVMGEHKEDEENAFNFSREFPNVNFLKDGDIIIL